MLHWLTGAHMRTLTSFRGEFLLVGVLGAAAAFAAGCGDSGDGSAFVGAGTDAGSGDPTGGGDFGDGGGGGTITPQVDSLSIDPPDATVTVNGTTAVTAS